MTKPSRPSSHGRDAFSGSSLRVDSAFIAKNPPTDVGGVAYSAPPSIIASATPYWIMRIARTMLWVAVVHAVTAAMFGPLAPGSEARRGGTEGGCSFRSRWLPNYIKTKKTHKNIKIEK